MKAKHGDLVVVHTRQRDYVIGQPSTERDQFTVGVVTNITREGEAKRYREAGWGHVREMPTPRLGYQRHYVVSKQDIDVEAAVKTVAEHVYPNSTTPRAYESLTDIRAALWPHRTVGGAS